MARPSVKAERTEEILDAFERCVARLGIEGTTLERIAEESGLRRSLLRYHVGNRDKLVQALADRYIERTRQESEALEASMPKENACPALLDALFNSTNDKDIQYILVAEALVAGAGLYPSIKDRMVQWYRNYVAAVANIIKIDFPRSSDDEIRVVAWGIVSIVFNVQSLVPLDADAQFSDDGVQASMRLLASLNSNR